MLSGEIGPLTHMYTLKCGLEFLTHIIQTGTCPPDSEVLSQLWWSFGPEPRCH